MIINFRDTKGDFKVLDNFIDYQNDPTFAVSITANTRGFLPAKEYIHTYHLNLDKIQNIEDECNSKNRCIFIEDSIPKVVFVPRTKGKNTDYTTDNFFETIAHYKIETLHFTHYNWLLSFPEEEIRLLLKNLTDPKLETSLKQIYIDTPDVVLFEKILDDIQTNDPFGKIDSLLAFIDSKNYICPDIDVWFRLTEILQKENKINHDKFPPPLILAGWSWSDDSEKKSRFKEHIFWAEKAGLIDLTNTYLRNLKPTDWY
jgi:hypothetical protein